MKEHLNFSNLPSPPMNLRLTISPESVRVGTDATSWEGTMMDVLTRRIYRNRGTGAFSRGNDI